MGSSRVDFRSSARAKLRCGRWDLTGPGVEICVPALQGRFLPTGPPGEVPIVVLLIKLNRHKVHSYMCLCLCVRVVMGMYVSICLYV